MQNDLHKMFLITMPSCPQENKRLKAHFGEHSPNAVRYLGFYNIAEYPFHLLGKNCGENIQERVDNETKKSH